MLFLFVVAIPIVVAGIYVIRRVIPVSSCFDNKLNQEETKVDCGGTCVPCALKYAKPLAVYWARVVPVRSGVYDVAAEIENPNELASSANVQYEFGLYDDFGPVVKRTGHTFIFAQERMLVIETSLESRRRPSRAEFKILKTDWRPESDLKPTIAVERREYKEIDELGKTHSLVEATLVNQSSFDLAKLEVQIAVIDAQENLLGANRMLVENLHSGERRVIKSVWPEKLHGNPVVIKVEPRVNIFDPLTILKPE